MKQHGFTLLELMIVVAIVGILAAIAVPMYSDYYTRSQIVEGINLTGSAKVAVADFYMNRGTFPTDNDEASLSDDITGKYVSSITVTGPIITVLYGNKAKSTIIGQTLTLTATPINGSLVWTCASDIEDKLLPSACDD